MKKIAVIASGWHFPHSFYRDIARQKLPKGWSMDLFCVSHRDPSYAKKEKKHRVIEGDRADLDHRLYDKIADVYDIEWLGWEYKEYPNTVGDWGNSNQWLETNDYKEYDFILFTHDDNLILTDMWFYTIIKDKQKWDILSNSLGMPKGSLRGSCEFFKRDTLEKMGGKFDLSDVTLSRVGKKTVKEDLSILYDWNNLGNKMAEFIQREKIAVAYLSPSYRVSAFCIEGERGYIGNTHGENTKYEDEGLAFLKQYNII